MSEPTNDPPTPPDPQGTLNYRGPGPEPKSQWLTDDQAYGACLVYALLVLTAGGAVIGVVGWIVWMLFGMF